MDRAITAEQEAYRKLYDTALSALLSTIWGGNLHMGLFEHLEEPLERAQLRAKDHMARSAVLQRGQRVFEAACGVGTTAMHLARKYGVFVRATNIAHAQLEEAAKRVRAAGLTDRVSFAFADYHDLGDAQDAYDCWWCQEALLYAADRARVFAEARRVVKPGGKIVFTDLTLSSKLPGEERQSFMKDIRAPHLWPIEDYDRLFHDMNIKVVEREERSAHTVVTFDAVARNLARVRDEFAARIGEETVKGTEFRISRQLGMARAGHLGWCFFALEV
ncbi:MAG TPA: class I SAM-dependent methyltransferase [Aestuariivirgaceae bacterium]|jgi:sarcosine/dimethylglycine N-methyltransferase